MPLSFLAAKAIVSPNKPVIPGSQEHLDILEMMRQSGRVFADENIAVPPAPPPTYHHPSELLPWRERTFKTPTPKAVSKKDWLSIAVNKERYEKHLVDHQPYPPGYWEAEPAHHGWKGKTCTHWKGQSKREWVASLKENNITEYIDNNGTDERRIQEEATGEDEGGAGKSEKDA
jgi:hypothetical protein